MRLSYVIISYNRKETLLKTLELLPSRTPLPSAQWDVWVVDNASTDGTPDAVASAFPRVNLLRMQQNIGMSARNAAFFRCQGQYIITLDDDSYPNDESAVPLMLDYLDENPHVGAIAANVVLPSGKHEAPALPSVVLGGATCFRRNVLERVGGYPSEFFRQAEEYDLSCRIWGAGLRIERFEDIVFRHDKVDGPGRASEDVQSLDLKHNVIVARRYLPEGIGREYARDWDLRYSAIGRSNGFDRAIHRARWGAWAWMWRDRWARRKPISISAVESMFCLHEQEAMVRRWKETNNIKTVVIADFSKNIYATWWACKRAKLNVLAVADDSPAYASLRYRDIPLMTHGEAAQLDADGVIVSNINPAQIDSRIATANAWFDLPVLRLWNGKTLRSGALPYKLAA